MKIYRAWTDSNHKIQYTIGYFKERADAEQVIRAYGFGGTASGPAAGG